MLLQAGTDAFSVSVSDPGEGPAGAETHVGLGTRIIETLARQLHAAVAKERLAPGYRVTITVPHGKATR